MEKPITEEQLLGALDQIEQYIVAIQKTILVVEDTVGVQKAITDVFRLENVNLVFAESGKEAEAKLNNQAFDCMILDLGLSDMTGFDLLEKLKNDDWFHNLPIIIYTAKDLSREEANQLRKYSKAIIIKTVGSIDRLLEETLRCIYYSKKETADSGGKFESTENLEGVSNLEGKKILLVDDDIRNIYALTRVLETKKMRVETGKNGEEALEKLQSHSDIQMVLMDIMMPVMDGITAIKEIRKNPKYKNLPIIALTAKAMKGDRKKCLNAGASDYLTKPVDTDLLFSTIQTWLFEKKVSFYE
jgi:CheY-like chemotaxis protein